VTIDAVDAKDPIYGRIGENMWVFLGDLRKVGDWFDNPVTPILPFQITTSYIWGYRNGTGFDCSGLTQAGWLAMGIACPRDADQQEQDENLGTTVAFDENLTGLQPFDVVYWPNHLALMITDIHAIHAKGSEVRKVVIEPIKEINEWRLAEYGKVVRTIKRRV
jgi:cell wall-associated NlpC family hydrolase